MPERRRSLACGRQPFSASVLLLTFLFPILGVPTTALADASIVVNTLAPFNEGISGNDDLGDLKRIYQGANSPAEQALEQFNQVIADTGLKRARLLQSDVYCDLDVTGKVFGYIDADHVFHAGDCYPMRWHLDWALDHGLTPHVAVASFMPASMVTFGPGETWASQPGAVKRYEDYMKALVDYVAAYSFQRGASNIILEVSNELDIADSEPENFSTGTPSLFSLKPLGPWGRWLWWPNPSRYVLGQWPPFQAHLLSNAEDETMAYPYRADVRRLSRQLLPVQKIVAKAIEDVRKDFTEKGLYGGKSLELAGPAFAGLSFTAYHLDTPPSPTMEEQFLDQTFNPLAVHYNSQFNARILNRFSFHFYGSTGGAAGFAAFDNIVDTVSAKLQALKQNDATMPDVNLFISEWGPTIDEGTDINVSHKGAAWAAAFLPHAVGKKISLGSYLVIGDGQGSGDVWYGQASLLHKHDNGKDANGQTLPPTYYPKPVANLFAMYNKMSGLRRQATLSPGGSGSNLGTFATWDAGSMTANIMVYNYDPSRVFGSNTSTEISEGISLEVDNLPFSDNSVVTIERYAINADTSNLAAFYSNPTHPLPNLQRVLLQRTINNGKLVLTGDELKLGVLLYRVLPPGVTP
ncbi:hypothetical protein [Bradyrhizobium sp. 930_D9_N1_4]|uniref:hypothetical protein n=1 Tax=Bradyrhizobium sp. 930_D9_N1_4 TaxID=3240374 RepID=UPI003F88DE13